MQVQERLIIYSYPIESKTFSLGIFATRMQTYAVDPWNTLRLGKKEALPNIFSHMYIRRFTAIPLFKIR